MAEIDLAVLAKATDGLTGADLKRLIEDGKILYVYDRARNLPTRAPGEYFLSAIETVRANKERYAVAEAHARRQRPTRPAWFDVADAAAAAMMNAGAGAGATSFVVHHAEAEATGEEELPFH